MRKRKAAPAIRREITFTRMPHFISFEVYRAREGCVLYALDSDGSLWEKYPNRPWGLLSFDGAVRE